MSGTATQLNPVLADVQARMARARAAGATWDEVGQFQAEQVQRAQAAGATEEEIKLLQGQRPAGFLDQQAATRMGNEMPPQKPTDNAWEAFKTGLQGSSTGLMLRSTLPDYVVPGDAGFASRIAEKAGVMIGDIPAMVLGGIAGGAAGGAAGSAVPVVGNVAGGLVGAGAGAFALPEAIRGEYIDALMHGWATGPRDFAERQAAIMWNTAKAAAVGAVMGPAGKTAGFLAKEMGAGAMGQFTAKTGAELGTMTGVASALEGHLPSMQDLADNAVLLIGAHVALKSPTLIKSATENLAQHWKETGETPADAVARATHDPILRQNLILPRPPEPGFKATSPDVTPGQEFVVPPYTMEEMGIRPSVRWITQPVGGFNGTMVTRISSTGEVVPDPNAVVPYLVAFGQKAGFKFQVGPGERPNAADTFSSGEETGPQYQAMGHPIPGQPGAFRTIGGQVYLPDTADALNRRWYGLGQYEILYHEVGHALIDQVLNDGVHLPNGAPPETALGQAIKAEMLAASKNFRPKLWDRAPEYNSRPEELMADAIAVWLSDSTMRQRMPEFTKAFGDKLDPYRKIAERYLPTRIEPERLENGEPNPRASETAPEWAPPAEGGGTRPPPPGEGPPSVGGPGEQPRIEGPQPTPPDPWAVVHSRFAPAEQVPGWWDRLKRLGLKLHLEFFEPDHPLNQAQHALEVGGAFPDAQNPKFLRRIAELSDTRSQYMIERSMLDIRGNVTGPGLNAILEPFNGEKGDHTFMTYALARIAVAEFERTKFPDANRRGRAVGGNQLTTEPQGPGPDFNPTSPGLNVPRETGVDYQAAKKVVTEGHNKYSDAYQQLVDWRNGTLEYARDGGLISPAAYAKLVKQDETGLPLYRREQKMAEHALEPGTGGKLGASPTKAREGSDLLIEEFVGSLMKDAFRRVRLANNNLANRALADAMAPTGMATRLDRAFTPEEARAHAAARGPLVDEQGNPIDRAMVTLDDIERAPREGPNDNADTTMQRVVERRLGWTFAADQVPIFRDGLAEKWRFFDPDIASYMKGFDQQTMATWQRMMVPFARFGRAMTVLNPLFPVRLMLYDLPWQFITKPGMRNTLADYFVGLRHTMPPSESAGYDQWMRSGGAEKVFGALDQQRYIRDQLEGHGDMTMTDAARNVVNSPLRALQYWGKATTEAIRVGRFVRGIEAGESQEAAASASTESAFHRAGFGGPATKNINAVQPFFAAYVNGLYQTFRGQFGIGKTVTGDANSAWQFTAKAAAIITLPMLANWAYSKDEDWWKAAPDWQKDNGFLFRVAGATVFIPMPPILGFMYGGIPRRLLEAFVNDNPDAMKNIKAGFGAAFVPPAGMLMMSAFTPMIEHVTNHSFFRGRPIVSDAMEQHLSAERYSPWSTATSKGISKFLSPIFGEQNAPAPVVLDHYIQAYGGTLGASALKASELALQQAGVIKPNAPASHLADWPLLSSWMARSPSATNQPMLDFEERMKGISQFHNSMNQALHENNAERFTQLTQENPAAAVLHQFRSKVPAPKNADDFKAAYQQAVTEGLANKPALQKVELTDRALKLLHEVVRNIGALPNEEPLTVAQQKRLGQELQLIQDNPPNPPGRISATDKRQLLDMAYDTMQKFAETGLKAMNQAHIK